MNQPRNEFKKPKNIGLSRFKSSMLYILFLHKEILFKQKLFRSFAFSCKGFQPFGKFNNNFSLVYIPIFNLVSLFKTLL